MTVRCAVLGAGRIGQVHARALATERGAWVNIPPARHPQAELRHLAPGVPAAKPGRARLQRDQTVPWHRTPP